MGTKMGPSYACLFMGYLEIHILEEYTKNKIVPLQYLRYIDDGFGLFDTPLEDINRFIDYVGNFHPSIKFTSCISFVSVNFLDISFRLSPGCSSLLSSIFYKPTDAHSYLLCTSSHPRSCRDSILFSQRLRRLCQDQDDFLHQADIMLNFFCLRLYRLNTPSCLPSTESPLSLASMLSLPPPEHLLLTERFLSTPTTMLRSGSSTSILPVFHSDPNTHFLFPKPPLVIFKPERHAS
jgi:hypothetical protein